MAVTKLDRLAGNGDVDRFGVQPGVQRLAIVTVILLLAVYLPMFSMYGSMI